MGILSAAYSIRFLGVNFQVPLSNYFDLIASKSKLCLSLYPILALQLSRRKQGIFRVVFCGPDADSIFGGDN